MGFAVYLVLENLTQLDISEGVDLSISVGSSLLRQHILAAVYASFKRRILLMVDKSPEECLFNEADTVFYVQLLRKTQPVRFDRSDAKK